MVRRFHSSAIGSFRCRKHGKDCYASQKQAVLALWQIQDEIRQAPYPRDKIPQRVYYEDACGFWHLTSKGKVIVIAYAKWGWENSDVYLIGGVKRPPPDDVHVITCVGCLLIREDPDDWLMSRSLDFGTKQEILDHLSEHEAAGHVVPDSAISAICADDWVT